MIGARDVAFPRLNALSLLDLPLRAACSCNVELPVRRGARRRLVRLRQPDLAASSRPAHTIDFWMLGLQILGISSLLAGFNFLVTIINMRAPGMTLMRMPVFIWMSFVTQFLHRARVPGRSRWRSSCSCSTASSAPSSTPRPRAAIRCSGSTSSGSSATRGLHPDPARDGHRLRGAADLRAQAALRRAGRDLLGHHSSASSGSGCGATTCSRSGMGPVADAAFSHHHRC